MFETLGAERRDRRVAYETLPLSIAIHGAAVALAIAVAVWNIALPTHSPRLTRPYALASTPDPPLPPAIKLASQKANAASAAPLNTIVAPTVIPDLIPVVNNVRTPSIFEPGLPSGEGVSSGGSPDGVVGGVLEGIVGGIPLPDDGRIHIERDKPLPLIAINHDYPDYPESALQRRKEATVIVRYVIGKEGWIKELEILHHAEEAAFDESVLKALRQWRFVPLTQDGKPIEVVHELTVIFQLIYR
jgi:TonB family protein